MHADARRWDTSSAAQGTVALSVFIGVHRRFALAVASSDAIAATPRTGLTSPTEMAILPAVVHRPRCIR